MPMVAGRSSPDRVDAVDVVVGAGAPAEKEAEFAAFMARSAPALARTAWLLCGDAHQAEELVQQALIKTYLAWPRARQGEPLAYARRVLANLRIDGWRRRRRELLVAPDALPDVVEGGPSAAERHAERDRLVRALLTLPARQRRIVVLRHLEGLPAQEVADTLGVSLGTVKSTASRGLARLRGVLQAPDTTTDERSGS
ncbi:DNA-directed RNA polymerase sigma-70 factor [Promicromonospora citrea]|uniref:DNA-directed RNA polymerase sigma-70 factor n=2 Tax=Promicromonospora citrea TaxID=43677 RepID=A0A8H9GD89_9MICO|nr:DNA-directed RNA polymerase sigma-70 factor [Promicromonospora citrea]